MQSHEEYLNEVRNFLALCRNTDAKGMSQALARYHFIQNFVFHRQIPESRMNFFKSQNADVAQDQICLETLHYSSDGGYEVTAFSYIETGLTEVHFEVLPSGGAYQINPQWLTNEKFIEYLNTIPNILKDALRATELPWYKEPEGIFV